jgi:hypothetical protein
MIETDILLAIFGARNEKILILQIKGEAHINSAMQGAARTCAASGGAGASPRDMHQS